MTISATIQRLKKHRTSHILASSFIGQLRTTSISKGGVSERCLASCTGWGARSGEAGSHRRKVAIAEVFRKTAGPGRLDVGLLSPVLRSPEKEPPRLWALPLPMMHWNRVAPMWVASGSVFPSVLMQQLQQRGPQISAQIATFCYKRRWCNFLPLSGHKVTC